MFTFAARVALCALIPFATLIPSASHAQSQHEMNAAAAKEFQAADRALNKEYNRLTGLLDAEARMKLKEAQRAWIQFRDAEAAFAADQEARGGSMAPLVYESRRAELTKARTKELQRTSKERAS